MGGAPRPRGSRRVRRIQGRRYRKRHSRSTAFRETSHLAWSREGQVTWPSRPRVAPWARSAVACRRGARCDRLFRADVPDRLDPSALAHLGSDDLRVCGDGGGGHWRHRHRFRICVVASAAVGIARAVVVWCAHRVRDRDALDFFSRWQSGAASGRGLSDAFAADRVTAHRAPHRAGRGAGPADRSRPRRGLSARAADGRGRWPAFREARGNGVRRQHLCRHVGRAGRGVSRHSGLGSAAGTESGERCCFSRPERPSSSGED